MSTEIKLKVTEIQRFCMHDGPGIRTTVFLKGCPLRCAWCHNPETQKPYEELLYYDKKCVKCGSCASVCTQGVHSFSDRHLIERNKCIVCRKCGESCPCGAIEICGRNMSIDDILSFVRKDAAFYGDIGGVTLSGGEPFVHGGSVVTLLKDLKKSGFNTAVETCGYADSEILSAAAGYVDLFLWDIKDTDDERHKAYTGVSNKLIINNLKLINELNAKIRLRCILVSGVNTDDEHYINIARIAGSLNNLCGVELIPYHAYAGTKAVFLGNEDNGIKEWIPSKEEIDRARFIIENEGITVK